MSFGKLALLASTAVISFILASVFFAWLFTHPPKRSVSDLPADYPFPVETVTFTTSDSLLLQGWYLFASDSAPGMIMLHGYSANRRGVRDRAAMFREEGYNVLLYDARGCGQSEGDYTTIGLHEKYDLLAAIEWMRARGIEQLSLLGLSQGGATILLAADQLDEIRCVVVESTYPDLRTAIDRRFQHYAFIPAAIGGCLLIPFAEAIIGIDADEIQPVLAIKNLHCPLLVVSGTNDRKTTAEDTHRLFDAAPQPKELWMIEEGRHEGLFELSGEEYREKVVGFVNRYSVHPR